MPLGNELNAVFPERKVELHRTCVRVLDKSVSPMQNTFNYKLNTSAYPTSHEQTGSYAQKPKRKSALSPGGQEGFRRSSRKCMNRMPKKFDSAVVMRVYLLITHHSLNQFNLDLRFAWLWPTSHS